MANETPKNPVSGDTVKKETVPEDKALEESKVRRSTAKN